LFASFRQFSHFHMRIFAYLHPPSPRLRRTEHLHICIFTHLHICLKQPQLHALVPLWRF
jgi:hypothetical protein